MRMNTNLMKPHLKREKTESETSITISHKTTLAFIFILKIVRKEKHLK